MLDSSSNNYNNKIPQVQENFYRNNKLLMERKIQKFGEKIFNQD